MDPVLHMCSVNVSLCQRTGWGCLPPSFPGSGGSHRTSSLTWAVFSASLAVFGWLFLLSPLTEMPLPPSTAGNQPQASKPQGLLNHPRFWFCGSSDVTPTSDTLTVASPPLSGGGFPGGFESLVCWWCVDFKCLFRIFQCLMRERLSTGKNWVWRAWVSGTPELD